LELQHWYENTTDNDLLYWGLDYPPLTAYHSWLLGKLGSSLNSSWVSLGSSRGEESYHHKLFMRATVLVSDLLVLFPASSLFLDVKSQHLSFISLLTYPGLIIIDHGHFQYNNMSLGFFLLSVAFILRRRDYLGSLLFVLALNYKQMELYHALPIFFYLLGLALKEIGIIQKLMRLATLAVIVLTTFAIIWSPFLWHGVTTSLQVLHRIFPFSRGLFEDKVANFWCSADVILKLKQRFDITQLAQLCLVTTLVTSLPSNLHCLVYPSRKSFLFSLVNTSLAFFLFSFQVHEKSILLAAVPVCLLYLSESDSPVLQLCIPWFLALSTFSMAPLLIKDGLLIPALSLSILAFTLITNINEFLPRKESKTGTKERLSHSPTPEPQLTTSEQVVIILRAFSLLGCIAILILAINVHPPPKYPFLWPLLMSSYSAVHFLGFFVYFHYHQFTGNPSEYMTASKKTN